MKVHIAWLGIVLAYCLWMHSMFWVERQTMWGEWRRHWQEEWAGEQALIQDKVDEAIKDFQLTGNKALHNFHYDINDAINAIRYPSTP